MSEKANSFFIQHEPLELPEDQLTSIRDYSRQGERRTPLVFHGRNEIREQISQSIEMIKKGAIGSFVDDSLTYIISGVPGSGKTSLLRQFSEDNADQAYFINVLGSDLADQAQFITSAMESMEIPRDSVDIYKSQTTTTSSGLKALFANLSRNKSTTIQSGVSQPGSHWYMLEELLMNKFKTRKLNKPIVLCVDEAQNIQVDSPFTQLLIQRLHTMRTGGLKIIPIFAGLSNTTSQLSEVGLSRPEPKNQFTIGKLSKFESKQVVTDIVRHEQFGLTDNFLPNNLNRLASILSNVSEQWPRHLNHYIKGFFSILYNTQKENPRAQSVDIQGALDIGNQARVNYYALLKELMSYGKAKDFNQKVLANLFQKSKEISANEMFDLGLESGVLTNKEDFYTVLNECTKRGFLQEIRNETYSVPIPSLRTFLTNQFDPQETLRVLRDEQEKELDKFRRQI